MMSGPLISVALPVFNGAKYLREAIDSILRQSLNDFELLIINDGSTDESLAIVKSYNDPRIVLINNDRNRGLVASLNTVIDRARGKYIARMDSDDVSHRERFESQVKLMEAEEADLCGCHWLVINEEGKTIEANIVPMSQDSVAAFLSYTVPFAHGSVMLRRGFIERHGLRYDKEQFAEDYDLWIRCFEANAIFVNCDSFLFKHRSSSTSLSKKTHRENKKDTKMLRRRFVRRNTEVCLRASLTLLGDYSGLSQVEKIYLLFLSYRISLLTLHPVFWKVLKRSEPKVRAVGLFRILRG